MRSPLHPSALNQVVADVNDAGAQRVDERAPLPGSCCARRCGIVCAGRSPCAL